MTTAEGLWAALMIVTVPDTDLWVALEECEDLPPVPRVWWSTIILELLIRTPTERAVIVDTLTAELAGRLLADAWAGGNDAVTL